jgi:hypothetical protein
MKNIDVGELRPRQLIDEEDYKVQVTSNSNVQDDTIQASTSGSHVNVQDQVASTSSQLNGQASASNIPILQPTNIARDYPLDTIIGDISKGVQTRSRLASFCEHFSFVLFIEPKKIEKTLKDVDWINAMHEEQLHKKSSMEISREIEEPQRDLNQMGLEKQARSRWDSSKEQIKIGSSRLHSS